MQIFRYAEQGSIRMLWISGTNPLVSLPELHRARGALGQERLFTVVRDLYVTETAQQADIVLPAATWAEETGPPADPPSLGCQVSSTQPEVGRVGPTAGAPVTVSALPRGRRPPARGSAAPVGRCAARSPSQSMHRSGAAHCAPR